MAATNPNAAGSGQLDKVGQTAGTTFEKAFKQPNDKLVQAVLADGGAPVWGNRISADSIQMWQDLGVLRDQRFAGARNEIWAELVNRIGEVVIQKQDFKNPLDVSVK